MFDQVVPATGRPTRGGSPGNVTPSEAGVHKHTEVSGIGIGIMVESKLPYEPWYASEIPNLPLELFDTGLRGSGEESTELLGCIGTFGSVHS